MSNRTCVICGGPVPSRRGPTCSDDCKRAYKSEYDKARYAQVREAKILSAQRWYATNREKKRQYDMGYRERTREHRLAIKREWGRLNPKDPIRMRLDSAGTRVRSFGGATFRITLRDVSRMLARFDYCCAACGVRLTDETGFELDHVLPVARGGHHSIGNLRPTCRSCNRNRNRRLVIEWRAGKTGPVPRGGRQDRPHSGGVKTTR